MYRLSTIIEEVYQKYAKLAEKRGVRFNLDFPDMTRRIERPSLVRKPLEEFMPEVLNRAEREVSLFVTKDAVAVRDDGVALMPETLKRMCEAFDNVAVKSRVGFGTEIKIKIA